MAPKKRKRGKKILPTVDEHVEEHVEELVVDQVAATPNQSDDDSEGGTVVPLHTVGTSSVRKKPPLSTPASKRQKVPEDLDDTLVAYQRRSRALCDFGVEPAIAPSKRKIVVPASSVIVTTLASGSEKFDANQPDLEPTQPTVVVLANHAGGPSSSQPDPASSPRSTQLESSTQLSYLERLFNAQGLLARPVSRYDQLEDANNAPSHPSCRVEFAAHTTEPVVHAMETAAPTKETVSPTMEFAAPTAEIVASIAEHAAPSNAMELVALSRKPPACTAQSPTRSPIVLAACSTQSPTRSPIEPAACSTQSPIESRTPHQQLEELLNKLPSEDRQRWLHNHMRSKVSLSISNIMFWFKFNFVEDHFILPVVINK